MYTQNATGTGGSKQVLSVGAARVYFLVKLTWCAPMRTVIANSAMSLTDLRLHAAVVGWFRIIDGAHLPALRKIHISECTDADLLTICSAAPNLSRLRCTHSGFETIAMHCAELQSFRCCNYVHTSGLNIDLALTAIAAGCPNLTRLCVEDFSTLTDMGLYAVAMHCTQLIEFSTLYNDGITDAPLIALAHSANARTLQTVHIKWCQALTGECVVALAQYCSLLHTLSVPAWHVVLEYVKSAIPHIKRMQKLDLSYHAVDDEILLLIAEHMSELADLDIGTGGDEVAVYTSIGLSAIALQCEKLQDLNLCWAPEEDRELIDIHLKQLRPGLQIRHDC